jgi:putative membrane protein
MTAPVEKAMTNITPPPTANELAQIRTDLAAGRTLMAADRTLMAWVRTALSLNSFGITVYKVLQALQENGRGLRTDHTPANVGLLLVAMGTLAMLMGMVEYLQTRKAIQPYHQVPLVRPSLVMALLMFFIGLLLFLGIIAKVL